MSRCRCGSTWGGLRAEHCPACHETFSGTSAGDAHRRGPHDARVCLAPAAVGLLRHERPSGPVWCWPGRDADSDVEGAPQTASEGLAQ